MHFPKIHIPKELQTSIGVMAETHYDNVPLSGISVGIIMIALSENLINKSEFVKAKESNKTLISFTSHCAKLLHNHLTSLFDKENYNCMTLTFQELTDAVIYDQQAALGFRLQLEYLLTFNFSFTNNVPQSIKILGQKMALFISNQLDCISSFDCRESCYEREQWIELKDLANKTDVLPDYTLYKSLFTNDAMFESTEEFTPFKEEMLWYDKALDIGGINHEDATLIEEYLTTLSKAEKSHPLYSKLLTIYARIKETIAAKIKFEQSNTLGYEEETAPIHYGLIVYGGFYEESLSISQHVRDLNDVGESMVTLFVPKKSFALTDAIYFINKLCSLSKLCDDSLEAFVNPIDF